MKWPAHIEALQGAVVALGARELGPNAARWDGSAGFEPTFAAKVADWGLFGVSVPEVQGGAGAGLLGAAVVIEEVAAHSGSLAMRLALHEGVAIGFALGLADMSLLARLIGNGGFVGWVGLGRGVTAEQSSDRLRLQGSVCMAPGDGDLVVAGLGTGGPRVGFVAADQLSSGRARAACGLRAVGWTDVVIDADVEHSGNAAVAARLGARLSVLIGAVACGLARAAISQATAYAQVREQFGQSIAQFQAIQWKLANGATERDAAWLLVTDAAARLDAQRPAANEAAARAQLAAVRMSVSACSEALQVHGGYGYTREFPIERLLRDARACTAIDRGDDDLRATLAAAITARFE